MDKKAIEESEKGKKVVLLIPSRTDTKAILSYLLVKNKCWEYEQEWRIINIGEKNISKLKIIHKHTPFDLDAKK